jgi:hypothetical protein
MAATTAQRRRTAHAAAVAAKQRRQKIMLVVLLVLGIAALAYEAPGLIKRINGSSTSSSSVGPPLQTASPKPRQLPKAFRGAAADPFVARALQDGDSTVGPVVGRDPFASPSAHSTESASASGAASPLPQQIVIGKPSGKGATRGWIVILASIPTAEGRTSATTFAQKVRAHGVSPVSVLNSSNSRPLRGGYWVVYTGPVSTLSQVENLAAHVHTSGYGTAYIRELIVYH